MKTIHTVTCITNSMELNPSWEATSYAGTQESSNILSNPTAHYCIHRSPPLVPILSQSNLVHTTPSYLSKIHFNIVTCQCIARQWVGKQVPAKTDSW
jgi:hypothetical protein